MVRNLRRLCWARPPRRSFPGRPSSLLGGFEAPAFVCMTYGGVERPGRAWGAPNLVGLENACARAAARLCETSRHWSVALKHQGVSCQSDPSQPTFQHPGNVKTILIAVQLQQPAIALFVRFHRRAAAVPVTPNAIPRGQNQLRPCHLSKPAVPLSYVTQIRPTRVL